MRYPKDAESIWIERNSVGRWGEYPFALLMNIRKTLNNKTRKEGEFGAAVEDLNVQNRFKFT